MKQYQVVTAMSIADLIQQVNTALQEGWQLAGGIAVTAVNFQGQPADMYLQALGA